MWLPDPLLRAFALGFALSAGALAAGCTMGPVYSTGESRLEIGIAEPLDRLGQIAYRTLTARLAFSTDPTAPELVLLVSTATSDFGQSSVSRPVTQAEVLATLTYEVRDSDDTILMSGVRTGRATFVRSEQPVANDRLDDDTEERAVAAAAEAVRLALLAAYAVP